MIVGVGCLLVFLAMASLMYARRLSALLALPMMAVLIALIGGIPAPEILSKVVDQGALKLHAAYTTTMFGAALAELINKQGIAKQLIRWVAEFAGDNPFILGLLLTAVTALLFSTLGGLGAVIMVGTIVLPVMLSLGISTVTAGGLYLFGISLGGMFNLANWQLYIDVLNIPRSQITSFVLPLTGAMCLIILAFLGVELRKPRNLGYIAAAAAVIATGFAIFCLSPQTSPPAQATAVDQLSLTVAGIASLALIGLATGRHLAGSTSTPGIALLTPFLPLLLVLSFHWEIIPAFSAGIIYGALTTWQRNSINTITRSILDGVSTVIPAVVLMVGIGMLLSAVMHPLVARAIAPLLARLVPTHALGYIAVFTLAAPLSLYRGPLSLWGMGSGLVALVQKTTALTSQAIMGMLMSVGQLQGVCDPTNTHNIWIATYLGIDTQALLTRTIPYAWAGALCGLCLAVFLGYVAW